MHRNQMLYPSASQPASQAANQQPASQPANQPTSKPTHRHPAPRLPSCLHGGGELFLRSQIKKNRGSKSQSWAAQNTTGIRMFFGGPKRETFITFCGILLPVEAKRVEMVAPRGLQI